MKKMTVKEFKEILKTAEMDFDCWGWEGILNEIIVAQQYHEREYLRLNGEAMAKRTRKRWNTIYSILKERGYYKA